MSLPSATQLRQGYVFTGICDSVHRVGACMAGGGGMGDVYGKGGMHGWGGGAWQERRPLQRTVRILLECFLDVYFV